MPGSTAYGVTTSEVLKGLPFADGTVDANSSGLNTGLITGYINEGTSRISASLVSIGADPEGLTPDAENIAATGLKAYARAQCLIKRSFSEREIDTQWDIWEEHRDMLMKFVGGLGESDPTSRQIVSTSPSKPNRRFRERWSGF